LICSNAEANCVVLSDLFAVVRMKVFFSAFVTMLSWYFHLMQSYETTEHKIRREFEAYGPIKRVGTSEWFLKQLTAITIGEMYEWLFCDVSAC
jgi:hypothetical protein